MNIQILEYLTTNYSILDLVIATIVIASILIVGFIHFSESKKTSVQSVSLSAEETEPTSNFSLSPQITIVFQKDISNDEELSKEIADIYISNRTYYYAGIEPPINRNQILSEKHDDVFIEYENVNFSTLNKIDI